MNFYDSIIEGAQELSAVERGQLYAACLEFLYYRREPNFKMKPTPKAMFVMMRPVLENQLAAKERGKKGGRPRKTKSQTKPEVFVEGQKTKSQTKPEVFENDGFSKSEQEQEDYLSIKEFSGEGDFRSGEVDYLPEYSSESDFPVGRELPPPTLEEVRSYCDGNGLRKCDPGIFFAYYESQGWKKPNGLRVTNWQALAQLWDEKDRNKEAAELVKKRTGRDLSALSSENWETL